MKAARVAMLLGTLALGGMSPVSGQPATSNPCGQTCTQYGERIRYVDFSDEHFDEAAQDARAAPSDLEHLLEKMEEDRIPSSRFGPLFWQEAQIVWEQSAFEQDCTDRCFLDWVSELSVRESIEFARDVVTSRYTFERVDLSSSLKGLPLEQYFVLGRGECDVYADTFVAAIDAMREYNSRLENVYVSWGAIGGPLFSSPIEKHLPTHTWNSIIIPTEDALVVSHVDALHHDLGKHGGFVPERGAYVPTHDMEVAARIYGELEEFGMSYALADRYFETLSPDDPASAGVLEKMGLYALHLNDPERMGQVRDAFSSLPDQPGDVAAKLLYLSGELEPDKGYWQELGERFPASPLVSMIE